MAFSNKKNVQIRQLMKKAIKENSVSQKSEEKKIESPLVKYRANGELYCILCKITIKSSNMWNDHCSSIDHKQKLLLLAKAKQDNKKQETSNNSQLSTKRSSIAISDNSEKNEFESDFDKTLETSSKKRKINSDCINSNPTISESVECLADATASKKFPTTQEEEWEQLEQEWREIEEIARPREPEKNNQTKSSKEEEEDDDDEKLIQESEEEDYEINSDELELNSHREKIENLISEIHSNKKYYDINNDSGYKSREESEEDCEDAKSIEDDQLDEKLYNWRTKAFQ